MKNHKLLTFCISLFIFSPICYSQNVNKQLFLECKSNEPVLNFNISIKDNTFTYKGDSFFRNIKTEFIDYRVTDDELLLTYKGTPVDGMYGNYTVNNLTVNRYTGLYNLEHVFHYPQSTNYEKTTTTTIGKCELLKLRKF